MRRFLSLLFSFAPALLILPIAGCSRLVVDSSPPGASVLWSPDGVSDWRPWPPVAWEEKNQPDSPRTPLRDGGSFGDTVWITVEKDGYFRPLPRTAELFPFRTERLSFDLVETPEAMARRMEAEGFVLWQGEWVRPEEEGLVEYESVWMTEQEAFQLAQLAKGLVEFESEWLAPAEAERRRADALRAEGLVPFKNRWVTPEAKAKEEAIDAEVAEIVATNPDALNLPRVVGPVAGRQPQLQLLNGSSWTLRVLMSGPRSQEVILTPYASYGLSAGERLALEPGRYQIAMVPREGLADLIEEIDQANGDDLRDILAGRSAPEPVFIEAAFSEGMQYLITFETSEMDVEAERVPYTLPQPELDFEIPQLEVPEIDIPEPSQRNGRPGGGRGGSPSG